MKPSDKKAKAKNGIPKSMSIKDKLTGRYQDAFSYALIDKVLDQIQE